MVQHKRIQSMVNHTDARSTGNKEAGLVNTTDFGRIPRRILKSKTPTFLFSATNGRSTLECCGVSIANPAAAQQ